MPSDCTTSYTQEEHAQTLKDIETGFGWVKTSDEILSLLGIEARERDEAPV